MKKLTAGTRGSALARRQTGLVSALLEKACRDRGQDLKIEQKIIKTRGDRILDVSLAKIPGKGLFTKELEVELLAGTIDFAVHSLKDLPGELPPGLTIGAYIKREDPRDVLISLDNVRLEELKEGAVIGTGSARRRLQLLKVRPDLFFFPIRGNIDTRIGKLEKKTEKVDAIVLARAGLNRLGLEGKISQVLPAELMMPAAGQGIIAVECRTEGPVRELLKILNDKTGEFYARAERALLEGLGGGCQTPAACITELTGDRLTIKARYMPTEALFLEKEVSITAASPSDAAKAGKEAARLLLEEYENIRNK